ncbi:RodZ domain-containing protein [Aquisalimonas asiatica]|uniref:Cytoskeleton protein RodZ n=1 Tax=Aquisalimonas asiatica TaxID=406100 RepID=A0A1H8PN48_9GAMM|nr:RodZ domain-containing protein [Aquisalimonas asiatica]SEO43104.1 cytoskeleton protein RodZ [Aquisalimonas asiatica]
MTDNDNENQEGVGSAVTGPGVELRAARSDKGMTTGDVATALHLSVQTIEDLEAENWSNLPPGPFVRGYIRAYAGLLELDGEELMRRVDASMGASEPGLKVSAPVDTSPQMPRVLALTGVGVVVFAVIAGAGWWFLDRTAPFLSDEPPAEIADPEAEQAPEVADEDDTADPADDDSLAVLEDDDAVELQDEPVVEATPDGDDAADDAPAAMLDPDTLADELASDEPLTLGTEEPPASVDDGDDPLAGSDEGLTLGSDEQSLDEAVEPDLASSEPAPSIDAAPEDETGEGAGEAAQGGAGEDDLPPLTDPEELVLDFAGPAWMEVTDARGERLLYGLVQDEGEQVLEGEAPFSVLVGDVSRVSVYFDDEAVELGPERPGRVVRVEVP